MDSNFASTGDIANLQVNGGVVATPNGLRARLTKLVFSIPSRNIYVSGSKFNDVSTDPIPKDVLMSSRIKGKNTCGWIAGTLSDGTPLTGAVVKDGISNNLDAVVFELGNGTYYIGAVTGGKLQIGGRNLCG